MPKPDPQCADCGGSGLVRKLRTRISAYGERRRKLAPPQKCQCLLRAEKRERKRRARALQRTQRHQPARMAAG